MLESFKERPSINKPICRYNLKVDAIQEKSEKTYNSQFHATKFMRIIV